MKHQRTFRLFISSTFKDFKKERAVLQTKVFSEIKKYCNAKGYNFQPIDLRWGVSEGIGLDQKTLELCLDEVRICKEHPYPNFLIMSGDVYGWVPLPRIIEKSEFEIIQKYFSDTEKTTIGQWYILDNNQIPPSYILKERTKEAGKDYTKREVWREKSEELQEILQKAVKKALAEKKISQEEANKYLLSATETEIKEGVFDYLERTAFQKKYPHLHETDRENTFAFVRNIEEIDKTSTFYRNEEDYQKAQRVKQEIKKVLSPDNILSVNTKHIDNSNDGDNLNYDYLTELEKKVFDFLKQRVDRHIESVEEYKPEELKKQRQQYFLQQKVNNFIGREDELKAIQDYVSGSNTAPLVVYGPSGIGKSALMAKAVLQTQDKYPNKKVVFNFVGSVADNDTTREVLTTIFQDLNIELIPKKKDNSLGLQETQEKPESFEDFCYRVYDTIAGLKEEIVIYIDAVDQFSNTDQFLWLPKILPANVKIIISTLKDKKYEKDSKYLETLQQKTDNLLQIPQFDDGKTLVKNILEPEKRTLTSEQWQYFETQYQKNRLPLYATIAAQEMKHWKSFWREYDLADTQVGIINEFIANLTRIHHHSRALVQKVFSYIEASEAGLSESEMLELLYVSMEEFADFKEDLNLYYEPETKDFPMAIWSRLFSAIRPFLGVHSQDNQELLYFFHREFKDSVNSNLENKRKEHEELIRVVQKLILKYQDQDFNANRWGKLYATLVVSHYLDYEDGDKQKSFADFVSGDSSKLKNDVCACV